MRLLVTLVFFTVALGTAGASASSGRAVATAAPAEAVAGAAAISGVAVVSSERNGTESTYRLRVSEQGRSAIVVVPYVAEMATLEINGVVRQRVGYNFPIGTAPLGHGMATFSLTNVRPTDRVVVRVWGSHDNLRILNQSGLVEGAHELSFMSGAYYAILFCVAFFIVVSIGVARDSTMAWYLAFTLSLILIELARDDLLPFDQTTNGVWLLVAITLSTFTVFGFYVSYLRLRTEAPRLLLALGFWTLAPWAANTVFLATTHKPLLGEALIPPLTVVLIACIVIAALRRRDGYRPATYIAIGFIGLTVAALSDIGRSLMHAPSPFFSRWEIEFGSAFDVLAFSVAVTIRSRYYSRDRAKIRRALEAASFDAVHDPLTGLLNRRGLEQRFASLEVFASTVLFIDLDGFKVINDRGGHAAGDDALKITSRILRNAVRADDVVARVGGDEFVVVLTDYRGPELLAAVIERISTSIAGVRPLGEDDPTRFGVSIGHAETEAGLPLGPAIAAADAGAYRIKIEHHAHARKSRHRRLRLRGRSGRA